MKIKKKYDYIIMMFYVLVDAIAAFMIIYPIATQQKVKITFLDIVFMIVAAFIIFYFTYSYLSIKYTIDDKHLTIQSGFSKEQLKLKDIISVRECRKYFSSTITATNCVEIRYSPYGKKADSKLYYLSVKDRLEFMKLLDEKCKHLN